MREQTLRLLIVVVLALGCADTTTSQTIEPDGPGLPSVPAPVITAEARTALARMSAYLVEAKSLGFSADVVYDVVGFDGQKIQYETQAQADWTHAGQLRINVDGDERQNQIYFNEGQVTFLDKVTNVYATDAVEGGLDAALDEMFVRLELRVSPGGPDVFGPVCDANEVCDLGTPSRNQPGARRGLHPSRVRSEGARLADLDRHG